MHKKDYSFLISDSNDKRNPSSCKYNVLPHIESKETDDEISLVAHLKHLRADKITVMLSWRKSRQFDGHYDL